MNVLIIMMKIKRLQNSQNKKLVMNKIKDFNIKIIRMIEVIYNNKIDLIIN